MHSPVEERRSEGEALQVASGKLGDSLPLTMPRRSLPHRVPPSMAAPVCSSQPVRPFLPLPLRRHGSAEADFFHLKRRHLSSPQRDKLRKQRHAKLTGHATDSQSSQAAEQSAAKEAAAALAMPQPGDVQGPAMQLRGWIGSTFDRQSRLPSNVLQDFCLLAEFGACPSTHIVTSTTPVLIAQRTQGPGLPKS